MKLALLTGIFPPDIGGPATHARNVADEFRRRGHTVTVFTLWDDPRWFRAAGIVRYPRHWPWWLRSPLLTFSMVRHRGAYDVIYATGLHPVAAMASKISRRPWVAKVVGDPVWERGRRLGLADPDFEKFQIAAKTSGARIKAMRMVRNTSLKTAAAITAPSESLAGIAAKWTGEENKVSVIRNGVRFAVAAPKPAHEHGHKAVFVGRLIELKRVGLILEALDQADRWSLEIIGDGPDRSALEEKSVALGLANRVKFLGTLSNSEVLTSLRAADILVLASRIEGLPHVAVEAQAMGTPTVAPRVGGLPELVTDGVTGLLIEPFDADNLVTGLLRLEREPELLRAMSNGCLKAAPEWTFDQAANQLEELLKRVSTSKGRFAGSRSQIN
ncbi:MAG: glycosyltransferase family 4 protein [Actinomycetota bacterium]